MMPEEWPIAAPAGDHDAPARSGGRDRLSTVRADFFLDSATRLTEQERALMTAMLHCLVGDIADELRAALPKGWSAANDQSNLELIEKLTAARLLDEPALMALLLRRADEERIANGAKARSGRHDARILQGLVSHDNGAISAAAMALILARGRRRDRFGQCLVSFDDLPRRSANFLVHAIGAALRGDLVGLRGAAVVDTELAKACRRVVDGQEPSRGIDSLTAELARLLDENARLDDELILAAAHEGEIAFVAEALARRAGLDGRAAAAELLSGDAGRLMLLFRLANSVRALVAGLLAGIGDLLGLSDAGLAIGLFDSISEDEVAAARNWLTVDPAYRRAISVLDTADG
jgi:Uncharacterised protein conserved in bacteria (DUF2336)